MFATFNNIFVETIEEDPKNGLSIPPIFKTSADPCFIGKVHYAGPDAPVVPGNVVAFNKWSGEEFILNGIRLLMLKPGSIFAVK